MSARKNILWGCVLASLLLLAVVAWKYFGASPPLPEATDDSAAASVSAERPAAARRSPGTPGLAATPADDPASASPVIPDPAVPWDEKLDSILRSTEPEAAKATNLLILFGMISGDPQEEVGRHLVNLLSDEQFPATVPWLTSTNTSEPVLNILMNDLLNRPEKLKLPLFLEVARIEGHPNAEEAKAYLEVYVDHDYGTNWDEWAKAVEKHLKEKPENPDEKPN